MRAQLRVPLWNEVRSYFSLGECTRSSSSAKPTISVSMPSTRLKSPTIGIEPPAPTVTALLAPFVGSAARALTSAGLSNGSWIAGEPPKLANSTLQSTGSRARTKARKRVADLLRVLVADQAERDLGRGLAGDDGLGALARCSRR